jgi:hypothetical protein
MKTFSAILVLAAPVAGLAYADCSYPQAPTKIPDGATATMQEMVAAMKDVKAYDEQIKAYTDCLSLEHDTALAKADPKMSKEQKDAINKIYIQKHDSAIDADTAVTTRFNEQVKIFKSKQKDKG